MAALDAVITSLLTITGLGIMYVNLYGRLPYYHTHHPLAESFPRLNPYLGWSFATRARNI